jgi:MFS family permease
MLLAPGPSRTRGDRRCSCGAARLLPTDFPRGVCIGRFATVLLLCMGNAAGTYVTQPYILFVYTNFFAGKPCETDAQTSSPDCKRAMELYLSINARISLCQAVLGILLFAVVGRISDSVGRRRCFVASMVPMVLQNVMLLLYAKRTISMYPYMATMCVPDFVWVLTFAYIADIMPPRWRATFFSWFIASFGVGNFINSALARFVLGSFERCATFALACRVAALALAILGLPESLPPAARKPPIDWRDRRAVLPVLNSLAQLRVLGRNSIFARVAVTLFVATLANHGTKAVQPPYLRQQLDFSAENFETQNMIAGVTLTVVNVAVTPLLIHKAGEQRTLVPSPPRHKYPDRNPDLTEISLRF